MHDNLERLHTGIGGLRPIDRINNVPSQYTKCSEARWWRHHRR